MNVNSILKKVLPVICTILLIVIITVTATAIKKNSAKTPDLGDATEEVYLSVKETLGGREFTYSITKGELYSELKGQIGLSTVITMTNKELHFHYRDSFFQHNKDYICYSNRVDIGGVAANTENGTCCGSFLNKSLYIYS